MAMGGLRQIRGGPADAPIDPPDRPVFNRNRPFVTNGDWTRVYANNNGFLGFTAADITTGEILSAPSKLATLGSDIVTSGPRSAPPGIGTTAAAGSMTGDALLWPMFRSLSAFAAQKVVDAGLLHSRPAITSGIVAG
jgi:hypothetical protein